MLGFIEKIVICTVLTFTINLGLFGQESWNLEKCVKTAIENNLSIKASQISLAQSEISRKQAQASRLPSLNIGTGISWNFGRSIDPTTNAFLTETFVSNNFSLNSGVVLYDGMRINNTIRQAKSEEAAAQFDIQQAIRDISLNVATVYLNVLFAEENLNVAENQLKLSKQQLELISKLISSGARPENERYDIEAQVALDEQQLVIRRNAYELALLQLKQIMLVDPDLPIRVIKPSDIQLDTDPELITNKEIYTAALGTQENIKAAEMRLIGADYGMKVAKAGYMPTVSLGMSLGTNYSNRFRKIDGFQTVRINQTAYINEMPLNIGFDQEVPILIEKPYFNQLTDNLFYGFGFQVRIPIYNNYQNAGNVQRAKLNLMAAENNLNLQKLNLRVNITQALADAKAAKKALDAANKSALATKQSYENATKRYEFGSVNSYDLANVKLRYDNALLSALVAKYDYIFRVKVLDFYLGKPLKFSN